MLSLTELLMSRKANTKRSVLMPQRLIVYTFQASSGIFEALTIYFLFFLLP